MNFLTKDNGFVDVFKLFDKIKLCNSRTRKLLIKDGEMFSNIGFPGLILILVAVLILFGPKNCRKSGRL